MSWWSGRLVVAFGIVAMLVGCDESPTAPEESPVAEHTVDARTEWAYVRLGTTPTTVTVPDPTTSSDWDLGFFITGLRLNSGMNGPGDVVGYCVCQNEGATPQQIQAMTPQSELADFEAVTAADIPTNASAWVGADEAEGGIFGQKSWYWYDTTEHQVWPRYDVYLIRRGTEVYKVQLIGYYGPAGEARMITFRSAKISR